MKESTRYPKIVQWSDEDQCFVGSCPGLFYGGCHGTDEKQVFDELCQMVEEMINLNHPPDDLPDRVRRWRAVRKSRKPTAAADSGRALESYSDGVGPPPLSASFARIASPGKTAGNVALTVLGPGVTMGLCISRSWRIERLAPPPLLTLFVQQEKSPVLDHIGIFVSDTDGSFQFFEAALAPLGIVVRERQRHWGSIIMSGPNYWPFLWIGPAGGDYHGTAVPVNERRPMHLAFRASSKEAVREFHRIGLLNGGRDNGGPEDCGRGAYGAYLLDPDGNNIEAVFRDGS